jgi:hypothetical protein
MKMMCVLACVIDESALPSHLTSNLSLGSTAVTAPPPPTPAMSATATVGPLSPPLQPSNTSSSSLNASLNTSGASSSSNLTSSTVSSQPQASLNTQSSSSPGFLKSKFSSLTESRLLSKNQSTSALGSPSTSGTSTPTSSSSGISSKDPLSPRKNLDEPPQTPQQPQQLPKTSTNVYLGYFQNSSHYLKLYENLKVLFNLYKKSPNIGSYDKFCQLLKTTLKTFAQLLESALSVHEVGPHLDEILLYLRVLFTLEPSCSVKCVTLTLKSLFGLNLAGLMAEYIQQQVTKTSSFTTRQTTSQLNALSLDQHQSAQQQPFKQSHSRTQSSTQSGLANLTASINNNTSSNMHVSLSGFSSVLSTSLTSIASLTTSNTFNQLAANCWNTSSSSKRQKTSLFSAIIENKYTQFNKFMYTQSLMFRNDNLHGLQFNSSGHLLNLGAGFGFDSIEYVTTSTNSIASISNASIATRPPYQHGSGSISSQSSLSTLTTTNSTSGLGSSTQTLSSSGNNKPASSAPFNLFGFMKKNKDKSPAGSVSSMSTSTASSSNASIQALNHAHNQQQVLIELQQQKIKQQKSDLKTISQYIKSFESIVIKSLRQYTLTTSVNLQTKILELLVQLIFLKVDYCLLDSDKVFIGISIFYFIKIRRNFPN